MKKKSFLFFLTLAYILLITNLTGCSNSDQTKLEEIETEKQKTTGEKNDKENEKSKKFLNKFLGYWYPNVGLDASDDVSSYIGYFLKIQELDMENRLIGTLTKIDINGSDEQPITLYWDEQEEVLKPETESDIISFYFTEESLYRGEIELDSELLSMGSTDSTEKFQEQIRFKQDMFELETDEQTVSSSYLSTVMNEVKGSWTGEIPSPTNNNYWMGFKINFESIDGDVIRGTYINIDHESSTPNYFKGVKYPFTATFDENLDVLLLDINVENMLYKFGLDGTFETKYGKVILSKN